MGGALLLGYSNNMVLLTVSVCRWSDSTAADYFNWEGGGPDDTDGQLCVSISVKYGERNMFTNSDICRAIHPFSKESQARVLLHLQLIYDTEIMPHFVYTPRKICFEV
jgi:hypothetical protein